MQFQAIYALIICQILVLVGCCDRVLSVHEAVLWVVTTVQVDLIKQWTFKWPRLETENFVMAIGSSRPMEDAARIAYRELIRWMVADFGFEELDAYMLLTQCGRVRLGNMVDPKYTLGASIKKSYLV